jgi:hypothetical protein
MNVIERIKQHRIVAGAFFLMLLIAIPVTVNFLGRQQDPRSRALTVPGTVQVNLDPQTKTVNADELFDIDVYVDGGSSDISAVDIEFTYELDPSPLLGGGGIRSFTPSNTFSTVTNTGTHYVGVNPTTNQITGNNKIGTLHVYPGDTGTVTIGFSKIHINASGVDGALDTSNTTSGTYTVTDATASITPAPTDGVICGQAFTWGRNTTTGECKLFPTTCLDEGYVADQGCALTGTPAPTATRTPTPTPTKTPTPTLLPPTATKFPTATLFPTATIVPGHTAIGLKLKLTAIGATPRVENTTPLRPQRNVQVLVINSQNNQTASVNGVVTLDPGSGLYLGKIDLGNNFTSGVYLIKVRMDNTLWRQIPGIQNITAGTINETQTSSLISGDLNQDNEINLLDYNILLTCLRNSTCRRISMTHQELKDLALTWVANKE